VNELFEKLFGRPSQLPICDTFGSMTFGTRSHKEPTRNISNSSSDTVALSSRWIYTLISSNVIIVTMFNSSVTLQPLERRLM
jgi:hypothetical protein